jgi:Ca2+-binding RTX toxin-like protein
MSSGFLRKCNIFHADYLRSGGHAGHDVVIGGSGRECYNSLGAGRDRFYGRGGNDEVYGAKGADLCRAERRFGCEA